MEKCLFLGKITISVRIKISLGAKFRKADECLDEVCLIIEETLVSGVEMPFARVLCIFCNKN